MKDSRDNTVVGIHVAITIGLAFVDPFLSVAWQLIVVAILLIYRWSRP